MQSSRRIKKTEVHSITTDSSNKNDIDAVALIHDVFDKSLELGKYLNRKNLSEGECRAKLIENSLFHTLIISRLSKAGEEEYESIVAREIISKLEKMNLMAAQESNCQKIEEKISLLLEQRLRSLSSY